jgi:penicillin-insensitive murein DD-endopeptidase
MRLSRNRNWGHPALIKFVQAFSAEAALVSGWNGLLIGDMAQPRGGPMRTGHASHQVGLDADIWWLPMPGRTLSQAEREQLSSQSLVRADRLDIDVRVWSSAHAAILRTASQREEVQRVFVNPAIKKALCRDHKGQDWLSKIRPTAGHDYHFHVRLHCPPGDTQCTTQEAVPAGDGCDASLDWWFTDEALNPKPGGVPKPPLLLADLPKQCAAVLDSE